MPAIENHRAFALYVSLGVPLSATSGVAVTPVRASTLGLALPFRAFPIAVAAASAWFVAFGM